MHLVDLIHKSIVYLLNHGCNPQISLLLYSIVGVNVVLTFSLLTARPQFYGVARNLYIESIFHCFPQ